MGVINKGSQPLVFSKIMAINLSSEPTTALCIMIGVWFLSRRGGVGIASEVGARALVAVGELSWRSCDARWREGEECGVGEQDAGLVVRSVARRGGELRASAEGARALRAVLGAVEALLRRELEGRRGRWSRGCGRGS